MTPRDASMIGGHVSGFAQTRRTDRWWVAPVLIVGGIAAAMGYMTWAAFQGTHYYAGPYLSPLYAPLIFVKTGVVGAAPVQHAWFGAWPEWWPAFLPASPAFLILAFPGSFRFTCYYYRKAYYRSFVGSPPACAVVGRGPDSSTYKGETGFLTFQNLHRYALYFALLLIPILYYDAALAFYHDGAFGIGVGSVVLVINATLLAGYTFGCHSFRHLIGGHDDCMSCGQNTAKFTLWKRASWFNIRHMQFAWFSLFWVAFSDLYVRLVSMGVIHDFNTWS